MRVRIYTLANAGLIRVGLAGFEPRSPDYLFEIETSILQGHVFGRATTNITTNN